MRTCTDWKKDGKLIYSKTCKTSRTKKSCRIAPGKYSGVTEPDMWTVDCSRRDWNARRGEWRTVPRGKQDVKRTIFAAKKAAEQFLKK